VQAADLTGWKGESAAPDFRQLCADIERLIGPRKKAAPVDTPPAPAVASSKEGPALGPVADEPAPAKPVHRFVTEWMPAAARTFGQRWALGGVLLTALVCGGYLAKKLSAPSVTGHAPKEQPTSEAPQSGAQTNPKDGLSYVWIAPGEFWMGPTPCRYRGQR